MAPPLGYRAFKETLLRNNLMRSNKEDRTVTESASTG